MPPLRENTWAIGAAAGVTLTQDRAANFGTTDSTTTVIHTGATDVNVTLTVATIGTATRMAETGIGVTVGARPRAVGTLRITEDAEAIPGALRGAAVRVLGTMTFPHRVRFLLPMELTLLVGKMIVVEDWCVRDRNGLFLGRVAIRGRRQKSSSDEIIAAVSFCKTFSISSSMQLFSPSGLRSSFSQ